MNATNNEAQARFSEQEFARLGMSDLAYIRPVVLETGPGFMIHAADGTALGVTPDRDMAFVAARQHGLEPQSIQ